jgi:hypothetical protein
MTRDAIVTPLTSAECRKMGSAERYRQNADDCRQRSLHARAAADKANWLKIAKEWQKLAEEVDVANVLPRGSREK